ncbi:bifunctional diguanylate cyclase/phosphodiesterase, partial [Acidocella sp.]|uniref:putative bifunctional diguanylate cyclase/phosphodiesterase n=1 Tax=Acidocella sp. TaxID=50710 RepID=UPI00260A2019
KAEEALRRAWTRNLADASFDGLLIHRQGVILQMNRTLVRMLGTREREWLGQNFVNLARPDHSAALRAELEAPQPQTAAFTLLRANKTEVPVEVYSHNIAFEGQPAIVMAIRDISQRLADAARIARLMHYDALTGLPNRALFCETLAAALAGNNATSGTTALLIMDLDQFKPMNDLLGRAGGDLLLKQVASRLAAMTQEEDTLARIGGDKFAMLIPSNGPPNRGVSLGGQIAATFHEPFIIDGQLIKLWLSIGLAIYPDHAADTAGLMKAAEFALNQAAQAGGGTAHIYSHHEAGLHRQTARHEAPPGGPADLLRLGGDLRNALHRDEISLVFQPVFRASDLAPAGFEALARWNHPTEGLIGPDRFIPLADATGLTDEIGCFVLEAACTEAARTPNTSVSINLSPAQLRDINLPARISAILRKTGLKPEFLDLEIPEIVLSEPRPGTMGVLQTLRATGAGLVLDHFGAKYSLLTSLAEQPFSRLKIDRRFTQKLGESSSAEAIVNAILAMAANLRLEVIAVGVETEAQLAYLRRLGCHFVQGQLLGPPTPRAIAQPPALAPPPRPSLVVSRG